MRKRLVIVLLCNLAASCGGVNIENFKSTSVDCYSRKQTSSKHWERVLFKYIDERLQGTSIMCLEDDGSSTNEIRVWVGFSTTPLRGIIMKQKNEEWTALFIPPQNHSLESSAPVLAHAPHSGWSDLLEKLKTLGIFELPDAITIGADNPYPDAEGIIIEIKQGGQYRTYMYSGFEHIKAPETQKVFEICQTLQSEFNLELGC